MKRILLLFVLLSAGHSLTAQTTVATPIVPGKKVSSGPATLNKIYYCCRYCEYTAINSRNCPVHEKALVKVGDWYCPIDGLSFPSDGKCTRDQGNLVKMEMKFVTLTPQPNDMKKAEPIKK